MEKTCGESKMEKILKRSVFLILASLFLGLHGKNLALLDGNTGKAIEIYPLSVSMLPKADQENLRRGITVESEEDLSRLLEDYLS